MISLDGCEFTTASLSKKGSPVRQDLVQSAGKVVKSIFVPNVGWASQVKIRQIQARPSWKSFETLSVMLSGKSPVAQRPASQPMISLLCSPDS